MNERILLQSNDLEWRDTPHAGVRWKKLRFDPKSRESAVLLRFDPGAAYGAHVHPKGEEYYVLEGSVEDGGRTYSAGSYVYHPSGSGHKPSSKEGCLLFVRLGAPIEEVQA